MKTIKERLTCIEVEMRMIKKLIYGIFAAIAAATGTQIIYF